MSTSKPRWVAGCMTGTSLDGLDASLVKIAREGLGMSARLVGTVNRPLGDLCDVLKLMAQGEPQTAMAYVLAARQLGELHADALEDLCRQHLPPGVSLDMAVAHGQTVWHAPGQGVSWQLMDPQPVVRRLGVAMCYDLRQADLIAGGEGAPITPISDWVMFRHPSRNRLIVNLGGISNVTFLPADGTPDQVTGRDVGPCNLLIDGVVRHLLPDRRIDIDGEIARQGRVNPEVYDLVKDHPAICDQTNPSLGREDFTSAWVLKLVNSLSSRMPVADILAGAVEAAARLIGRACPSETQDVVLAGGGARNPVLVERIRTAMGQRHVMLSDAFGVPVEARESMGFAVLGALCQDGVPISLPQITGSTAPGVAGHWVFPGASRP